MPSDEAFLFSGENAFKEKIIFTDASFLKVFGFSLLIGNPDKCLHLPSSLLINESIALKLFGPDWREKEILGQTVSIDGRIPLTITGVFEDLPIHSHFTSGLFASVPSGLESWMTAASSVYTYVLIQEKAVMINLKNKISGLSEKLSQDKDNSTQYHLEPITGIYLSPPLKAENSIHGNLKIIYSLILVALFLLMITIINFANLYTAKSFIRLKEIGVRKALGALSMQVRNQFLFETTLITTVSATVSIIVVIGLLPVFNELTNKDLSPEKLLHPTILGFTVALTLIISLLSGFYPSVYLSAIKTIKALKGTKPKTGSAYQFQRALIIIQFSISCIMIILSLVAFRQADLINNKSLGFDKENIIAVENPYMLGSTQDVQAFKRELLTVKGVDHISITGYTPSQNRWGTEKITYPEQDSHKNYADDARWLTVDEGFLKTMGLTLITGRNFMEDHENDKEAVLINESASYQLQLNTNGESPIGKELSIESDRESNVLETYKIIGVVNDFNFGSLHEPIRPVIMKLGYHRFELAVRLSTAYSQNETIEQIAVTWRKHLPMIPFEYDYIKNRFNGLHQSDITASRLFSLFCLLTVVMSVFGLFSMVTHTIVNRTKEIGIRKVLGASEISIVWLLVKNFFQLIAISYFLALPLGWIFANKWISDFAYKTEISWWIFALTGCILIFITLLTLGYQSLKASAANPVDNLRYE